MGERIILSPATIIPVRSDSGRRRLRLDHGADYLIYLFCVALFYDVYRYPFKINSELAASGYSATPLFLQAGKYVLVVSILAFSLAQNFLRSRRQTVRHGYPVLAVLYGFLIVSAAITGAVTGQTLLAQVSVYLLIPFCIHAFGLPEINPERLFSLLKGVAVFALAFNCLTVVLYLTTGRLPALAYRGTLSIRFGSYLDDPNGFGILLSCLIPFSWLAFSGVSRFVVFGGLVLSLPLTQSLSGILGTAIAAFVLSSIWVLRNPAPGKIILFCVALISVGGFLLSAAAIGDWAFVQDLAKAKQGSYSVHSHDFDKLFELKPSSWLGIDPTGEVAETNYAEVLQNNGILYLLTAVGLRMFACGRYYTAMLRKNQPLASTAVWVAFFCYLVCNLFVGFTLPIERSFPTNLLLILITALGTTKVFTMPVKVSADSMSAVTEAPAFLSSGTSGEVEVR